MMRRTWGIVATTCFALTFAADACAQVIAPVSQMRSVEAMIDDFEFPPLEESDSATDFGAYVGSVIADDMGIPSSRAEAVQESSINAPVDTLTASGAVDGFPAYSSGDAQAIADSLYRVEFDLSTPVNYTATGTAHTERGVSNALEAFVFANVGVNLRDVSGGGAIIDSFGAFDDDGTEAIHLSGTLSPGRYELSIFAGVDVLADFNEQFASASATYDVTFSVEPIPEPSAWMLAAIIIPVLMAAGWRYRFAARRSFQANSLC